MIDSSFLAGFIVSPFVLYLLSVLLIGLFYTDPKDPH